ncbi:MAG: hypothetical protein PHR82_09585 [Endomicrobiaceae bacterium]|nr:hypothetical protein [Endomicrobiaceae bacterium]
MALIKCEECGNEISSEAKACPKCGKVTNTGEILAKKSNKNLTYILLILGAFVGFIIGYAMCPKIPLLGKLPLFHILTAGSFLQGFDSALKPFAIESLRILLAGTFGGLMLVFFISLFLNKNNLPENEHKAKINSNNRKICKSCGALNDSMCSFCVKCTSKL